MSIYNYLLNESLSVTNEAANIPKNSDLFKVLKDCSHKEKLGDLTVIFMEKLDNYKKEMDNVKFMIKDDDYKNAIDGIILNELPDLYKKAINKSYYLEYYTEDECTYYIVFKCNNKKDKKYFGKNIVVMFKRLESVKSFTTANESTVVQESCHSFVVDTVKVKLNGKTLNCPINMDNDYKKDEANKDRLDAMLKNVPKIVKLVEGDSLWNYLYTRDKKYYDDEINSQSEYFDGKTIKSGKDLKAAVETKYKIAIYIDGNRNCVYFCGEYWLDPEHGFCITFPEGKYVKAEGKTQDSNYNPICTYMGQFSDAL